MAAVVASLLSARRGSGAPRPLACELCGFVAIAPRRAVRPRGWSNKNELGDRRCRHRRELLGAFSGDAFGGQECPPHTGFVASPLAAPRVQALPARLPANCPASSLSLLAGQFAQSWVCGKWGVCLVWRIGVRRGGFIGGRGWLRCGRSRGGGSRLLCLAAAGWGCGHHHVLVIADHVVGMRSGGLGGGVVLVLPIF